MSMVARIVHVRSTLFYEKPVAGSNNLFAKFFKVSSMIYPIPVNVLYLLILIALWKKYFIIYLMRFLMLYLLKTVVISVALSQEKELEKVWRPLKKDVSVIFNLRCSYRKWFYIPSKRSFKVDENDPHICHLLKYYKWFFHKQWIIHQQIKAFVTCIVRF